VPLFDCLFFSSPCLASWPPFGLLGLAGWSVVLVALFGVSVSGGFPSLWLLEGLIMNTSSSSFVAFVPAASSVLLRGSPSVSVVPVVAFAASGCVVVGADWFGPAGRLVPSGGVPAGATSFVVSVSDSSGVVSRLTCLVACFRDPALLLELRASVLSAFRSGALVFPVVGAYRNPSSGYFCGLSALGSPSVGEDLAPF